MKRSPGRPKGKKYPQPQNQLIGWYIAGLGNLATTDAMQLIDACFSQAQRQLKANFRKKRTCNNKNSQPRALEPPQQSINEIGKLFWQRLLAGDHEFFSQVAELLKKFEEISNGASALDRRRSLAIDYKFQCDFLEPFTQKGLAAWYKRHGHTIDRSTLSKIYRWAQSAQWDGMPRSLAPLIREHGNLNGYQNWHSFHIPEMDPDFHEAFLFVRKHLARRNCLKRLTRSQC